MDAPRPAPTVRAAQPKHENMARKVPRSCTKRRKSENLKMPRNRPSTTRICTPLCTEFESWLRACLMCAPDIQYVCQARKMYDFPKYCTMSPTLSSPNLFTMDFLEHVGFIHTCICIKTRSWHNLSPNDLWNRELSSKNCPNCTHSFGPSWRQLPLALYNFSCVCLELL